MLRPATRNDLITATSWIRSQQDCLFWAGAGEIYPLDMDALLAKLSLDKAYCLDRDDSLIAFGMLLPLVDGRGHLARLIVAPALRGQGVGRILVQQFLVRAAETGLHPVGLRVVPTNERAVRLYTSLGFVRTDPPDWFTPSATSCYMVR